jgi:membrane protein
MLSGEEKLAQAGLSIESGGAPVVNRARAAVVCDFGFLRLSSKSNRSRDQKLQMSARPTFKQFLTKIWSESAKDDVFGTAAELSYYFLLALFPLLIFLTSLIGFLPGTHSGLVGDLDRIVPPDAMKLVRDTLTDVVSHRNSGVLSFGLILSLWSASSGVVSLMRGLNRAYDIVETRSFWKRRLIAIGLTIAAVLLVASGSVLIVIGNRLGHLLHRSFEVSAGLAVVSTISGYVIGLVLLLAGIGSLYFFGPATKTKQPVKPGAVFATIGVVIGSLLFSLYLRMAPSASATYGSLGAVVTLMLWLYLIGLVLLVGGEINSEWPSRDAR